MFKKYKHKSALAHKHDTVIQENDNDVYHNSCIKL